MRHALTLTIIIIFGTIGCGDNRAKAQATTIPRGRTPASTQVRCPTSSAVWTYVEKEGIWATLCAHFAGQKEAGLPKSGTKDQQVDRIIHAGLRPSDALS